MIFQRKSYFRILQFVTLGMPLLLFFVLGRGITQACLMLGLWGCLFLASCFQWRSNRRLALGGFVVCFYTLCLLIALPSFLSPRHTLLQSKEAHIKELNNAVMMGGGESNLLSESQILFKRLSTNEMSYPGIRANDLYNPPYFKGLSIITNLGDVFYYDHYHGYLRIRRHNSHADTYFFYLLNPQQNQPANFEKVIGNLGFMEVNY